MSAMESLSVMYSTLFEDMADPRVRRWPLMGGPGPILAILGGYLLFVLWLGPLWMQHRKAKSLRLQIAVYNIFQVWSNYVITVGVLNAGWLTHYTLGCQPVDYSDDPLAVRMAELCWWTMVIKLMELLETVFFILRKKPEQASFLHLYHHVSTLLFSWIAVKYVPGGMPTLYVLLNCGVHVIMYLYYFLTGLSSSIRTFLNPWKKYLTILQMVQFCVMVGHSAQALAPSCPLHPALPLSFIPNVLLVFHLFRQFYSSAYGDPRRRKSERRE
uniref:Elongation of very long chain fatty acids protein n=1 Tax=Orthetrum albistylum TaxID=254766 RepID=A0A499U8T9_9ODON|nr:elongation of very long chain fatty acids protein 2 [Orthetrum albistylum]